MKTAALLAGAFALLAQPVLAQPWCMTRGGLPRLDKPAYSKVIYVPYGTRLTSDSIKQACGPKTMMCAFVTRAPLKEIVRMSRNQRAIGFTERQCGDTPMGTACVGFIAVAPAGSVDYAGRRIDHECEADTEAHELYHFFARDGWIGHHHGPGEGV